jgi:citrate synthase
MDINKNIHDTVTHIHNHILSNWNDIKNEPVIMNVLDINTNNMCKYYKTTNSNLEDKHIQSRALTLLISLLLIVAQPIDDIIDVD